MDLLVLLKGIAIGFIITAPIGPVAVLCIDRTLSRGRIAGFVSGLGAVTADSIYCVVAAFSITIVADFLKDNRASFQRVGGIFLLFIGLRILLSKPPLKSHLNHAKDLVTDYLSAFAVTITNPLTVVALAAIFAGVGLGSIHTGRSAATTMVLGVASGAVLCWFLLSAGVSIFRDRFKTQMLQMVRRLFGIVILIVAVAAII